MSHGPILVLLSIGRHPASGRARRAERDARALTLALTLADLGDAEVIGVHAGAGHEALRDYLGMGLEHLVVLDVPARIDPVAALSEFVRSVSPSLVFAGTVTEAGESTGLVPYLLADKVGMPLVPAIVAIAASGGRLEMTQALPRGGRRSLAAGRPLVLTVESQGPTPRQVARGPAMRGKLDRWTKPIPEFPSLLPAAVATRPLRLRPKRIGPVATDATAAQGRRLLIGPSPREAAEEILKFLEAERLLPQRVTVRDHEPENTR